MQPNDPSLPAINPRLLLTEKGEEALADLVRGVGYVIQSPMLRDLAHALRNCLPWLIEGPRGGGKTAMAEALAEACNLPVYYLQGMEGLTLADVLYDWDREAETKWVRQRGASGDSFEEARTRQWSPECRTSGEALVAYEGAAQGGSIPGWICAEFDKVSGEIEEM